MRKSAPIQIILHEPQSPAAQTELAKRVAQAHVSTVIRQIQNLTCPLHQKQALCDAVIRSIQNEAQHER